MIVLHEPCHAVAGEQCLAGGEQHFYVGAFAGIIGEAAVLYVVFPVFRLPFRVEHQRVDEVHEGFR